MICWSVFTNRWESLSCDGYKRTVWCSLNLKLAKTMSTFPWSEYTQYLDDCFYFYFQYKMSWKCLEPTTSKTFCYTVDWQLFITSKLQPNENSGFQLSAKCVSLQSFWGLDCTNYGRSHSNSYSSASWQLVLGFGVRASRLGSLIASKWVQGSGIVSTLCGWAVNFMHESLYLQI